LLEALSSSGGVVRRLLGEAGGDLLGGNVGNVPRLGGGRGVGAIGPASAARQRAGARGAGKMRALRGSGRRAEGGQRKEGSALGG
jgi:hypothetical protein